jgi:hypothetical protein
MFIVTTTTTVNTPTMILWKEVEKKNENGGKHKNR